MTKNLGPTFADELLAADLGGLPFSWGITDDSINGRERLSAVQNTALDGVIAAHNPAAKPASVIREEALNADAERTTFIDKLKVGSPAQIEAEIRGFVNADVVTDLPTARACLKRIETALVRLTKAVALSVR